MEDIGTKKQIYTTQDIIEWLAKTKGPLNATSEERRRVATIDRTNWYRRRESWSYELKIEEMTKELKEKPKDFPEDKMNQLFLQYIALLIDARGSYIVYASQLARQWITGHSNITIESMDFIDLLAQAEAYNQNLGDAETLYELAIKLDPNNPRLRNGQIAAVIKKGTSQDCEKARDMISELRNIYRQQANDRLIMDEERTDELEQMLQRKMQQNVR